MDNKELDQARQARNEYMKAYRAKNKDKVKAINNKYWINRAKKANEEGEKIRA